MAVPPPPGSATAALHALLMGCCSGAHACAATGTAGVTATPRRGTLSSDCCLFVSVSAAPLGHPRAIAAVPSASSRPCRVGRALYHRWDGGGRMLLYS